MSGAAAILVAYVLGAITFGPLVARLRGVDLRAHGSGNIGATNVGRVLGKRTGRLVLLLDALKGTLAVLLARALGGSEAVVGAAAAAAVLGHCFPIFLRFRGGKGAATALGVTVPLDPFAALAGGLGYVLLKRGTGLASAGSLTGVASALATGYVLHGASPAVFALVAVAVVVVLRHRENLRRLSRGEELPS